MKKDHLDAKVIQVKSEELKRGAKEKTYEMASGADETAGTTDTNMIIQNTLFSLNADFKQYFEKKMQIPYETCCRLD